MCHYCKARSLSSKNWNWWHKLWIRQLHASLGVQLVHQLWVAEKQSWICQLIVLAKHQSKIGWNQMLTSFQGKATQKSCHQMPFHHQPKTRWFSSALWSSKLHPQRLQWQRKNSLQVYLRQMSLQNWRRQKWIIQDTTFWPAWSLCEVRWTIIRVAQTI